LPFTPRDKHELRRALDSFSMDKERAIARYGNIDTWITTDVKDMSYLFTGLSRQYTFNNRDDIISNWDTSNVTNMRGLFSASHRFNQPLYWDTSKVEDMSFLFSQCERFNQVIEWDTAKVKTMRQMFFYCPRFNSAVRFTDTSNVENMDNMFTYCHVMTQDMSHLNVNRVVNFDPQEMFRMSHTIYREDWWPRRNYLTQRKSYIDLTEGVQMLVEGKYNTIQEQYLFRPEIVKEVAAHIF